MSTNYKLFKTS